ncbi:DUF3579 domain-containing protein [Paraburkholderia xenovorans]
MTEIEPARYFIQGITLSGKTFRPSDRTERLCDVMSGYGPARYGANAHLQYSPYVRPTVLGDVKVVILDERLRQMEPMAFEFVIGFARDNDLLITQACEYPRHDYDVNG